MTKACRDQARRRCAWASYSAVAEIRLWEGETVVRKRYQQGCCYPRLQALDAGMRPALIDQQMQAQLKTQERMRLPSGRVGKMKALPALRCDPALCRAPASCTPAGLAAAPDPNRRRPPAQAGAGKRAGQRRTVTSWLGRYLLVIRNSSGELLRAVITARRAPTDPVDALFRNNLGGNPTAGTPAQADDRESSQMKA
jgi:hypothetical protein